MFFLYLNLQQYNNYSLYLYNYNYISYTTHSIIIIIIISMSIVYIIICYNFVYALSTKFVYLTGYNKFMYSWILFHLYYIYNPLLIITVYHNCVYTANTAVSITWLKMLMQIEFANKTYPGRIEFLRGSEFSVTGVFVSVLLQGSPHFRVFSIEGFNVLLF